MMKDWLDASLFYVSNEPGFRVTTKPWRTYTISLSSSMMYIRQNTDHIHADPCASTICMDVKSVFGSLYAQKEPHATCSS